MILLHFDEIAERSYPAMMALPPFTINNKENIQGCVLSNQVGSGNMTIFYHTSVKYTKCITCFRCTGCFRCITRLVRTWALPGLFGPDSLIFVDPI